MQVQGEDGFLILPDRGCDKQGLYILCRWECAGDYGDSLRGTRVGIWSSLAQRNEVIKNVLKCRTPPPKTVKYIVVDVKLACSPYF